MKRRGFLKRLLIAIPAAALATELAFLPEIKTKGKSLHEIFLEDRETISNIVTNLYYPQYKDITKFPLDFFTRHIK